MVRLREVPRTAAFAWSPNAANALLATGTKAGAVDADFSNETVLEIWDLELGDANPTQELEPLGSISADSRFYDIAWSQPNDDRPNGIIAGALESGSLDLWDAQKLRTAPKDSHITRTSKHSGAIKALQFNPYRPELLATSGAKGELYIQDINNSGSSFRLGTAVARADDFDAVDWNKKVAHILVTGSSGGFATVWDVKQKKESLTLNNLGRKAISAIAWDPTVPTKLATATSNDQDPVILLWDLRNSNAPERTLRLHEQGILSLSWCQQDPRLLLSCGKDNRTICWDATTGEPLGEFPIVTNWTFQTRWNPYNAGLVATASFDGKISVHNTQSTNVDSSKETGAAALDGADFFASAPSRPQGAGFSLAVAPRWLERPVSVAFGFGGKIVKVSSTGRQSKVTIDSFVADASLGVASEKFEEVVQTGDFGQFCESKIADAKTDEDKADWTVIETLISGSRTKLVDYLGVSTTEDAAVAEDKAMNGTAVSGDDAFFDNAGDNFLSQLASTKGVKTNNPFNIYNGQESEVDRRITQSLVLGNFEKAVDVCIKEDRMSDAFMIANCAGQTCLDKVQAAYFKRSGDGPNYLRLIASVVGKNLWDVVYNADLADWKEVMATLCTFADEKEFPDLCEALGDRLEEQIESNPSARKDASFCYLAGSRLEKVVQNWAQELAEKEKNSLAEAEGDSSYSISASALQDFIEKVTVFRKVTTFEDVERSKQSDWKMGLLYAKYLEYADILASQGRLTAAARYLELLPAQYPEAEAARQRVRQATRQVSTKPATIAAQNQRGQRVVPLAGATAPISAAAPSMASAYAPTTNPIVSTQSPYAPAGVSIQAATPQPNLAQVAGTSAYTPIGGGGYQPPQASQPAYQPPSYGGFAPQQPFASGFSSYGGVAPPPRISSASPAPPPAANNKNLTAWNDTPDFGGGPRPSRRGTPAIVGAPTPQTFGGQTLSPPPGAAPFAAQQRASPAPPPKAGAARVTSPPPVSAPQDSYQPAPPAGNSYTPAAPSYPSSLQQPPGVPRGASPYNPPPAAAPSNSRYAPAPGSVPSMPTGPPANRQIAPPPTSGFAPPGAAAYSQPGTPMGGPPALNAPPKASAPPPAANVGPPPMGRSRGPSAGQGTMLQPTERSPTSATAPAPPAPAAAQYPPGDRSHIPPTSQPIFDVLNGEMQRVKAKAPPAFRPQVLDTEKRLNILFDALNNEILLKPGTIGEMVTLAEAIRNREHDVAQALFTEIMTTKTDEGSNWMVGVKRLIQMSRATPV